MKALRVMIKANDITLDIDNAWKNASRLKTPYNALISICLADNRVDQAFQLYNKMKKDGIFPNAATYNVLITGTMRAYLQQMQTDTIPQDTRCFERISALGQDLMLLWRKAFPRYFGNLDARPQTKTDMVAELDRPEASEQERRNLLSQQASIVEVQRYPYSLTHALGAYATFLRQSTQIQEFWKLFDRLFPLRYLTPLYANTIQTSSDDAHRTLLELLPIGDSSSVTTFWMLARSKRDPRLIGDPYSILKRVWDTWIKLMQFEVIHSRIRQSQSPRQSSKDHASPDSGSVAVGDSEHATITQPSRFVPDDRTMQGFMSALSYTSESNWKSLTLTVLESLYGLDLSSHCDGILRNPQDPLMKVESKQYLKQDALALDALPGAAQLRDQFIVHRMLRLLSASDAWKERIAMFNYLWARAFEEGLCNPAHPFGPSIDISSATSLIYTCSQRADPMAARVLLDHMNHCTIGTDVLGQRLQYEKGRQATEARMALAWVPLDICYSRTLKAIEAAGVRGSEGLTALRADDNRAVSFDAWKQSKEVFTDWHEFKAKRVLASTLATETRWEGRNDKRKQSSREPLPALLHTDAIVAVVLSVARRCVPASVMPPSAVAREALKLVDSFVGLSDLLGEYKAHLLLTRDENRFRKERRKKPVAVFKFIGLSELARALTAALNTEGFAFADAAEVQLWKSLKQDIIDLGFVTKFPKADRGSKLLLSAEDHAELAADDDGHVDDDMHDGSNTSQHQGRGNQRQTLRARHVEQELGRWVRGS